MRPDADTQDGNAALVLIVEDEPIQRLDMIDMVEGAGFQVVEAANADHAIGLLESRADIRLVLSDIDMPGTMDGLRLAAAVRRRWPPVEIILTTAGVPPRAEQMPEGALFLPKPLNRCRVVDAIRRFASALK